MNEESVELSLENVVDDLSAVFTGTPLTEDQNLEAFKAVEVPKVSDPSIGINTFATSTFETAKPERKGEDPDEVKSRISPYTVPKK